MYLSQQRKLIRHISYKHTHIPTEVIANLDLLCIGIITCSLSPDTPPSSGSSLPYFRDPVYFGFVGHCSWGVLWPAHLLPFLVLYIMPEIYNPTPIVMVRMIYLSISLSLDISQPNRGKYGISRGRHGAEGGRVYVD